MSCKSCKNKEEGIQEGLLSVFKKNGPTVEREVKETDIGFQIFNVAIRVLLFAIGLATTPLIMVFVVYLLFKTIILNDGEINLMPTLIHIAKQIGIGRKKTEEENPEDYEDLDSENPEEYDIAERVDKIEL